MRVSCLLAAAALATTACTGVPTGGNDPEPTPTGTILAGSPNEPEDGSYLINVETGSVKRIATGQNPFTVAFQGGYSEPERFVYGIRADSATNRVVAVSLVSGDTLLLAAMPDEDHLLGAIRLSPDGQTLAAQIWQWRIDKIELVLIDLATGTWTRLVDQVTGIDALPLASLAWSPDGRHLYVLTEVFPDRSELVQVSLGSGLFEIISPTTPINGPLWLDISPDGQTIAHGHGDGEIVFRNADGGELIGLPELMPRVGRPVWSPDGEFIAYQELGSGGERAIVLMRLSDGKRWPLEIEGDLNLWLSDWIPEGAI